MYVRQLLASSGRTEVCTFSVTGRKTTESYNPPSVRKYCFAICSMMFLGTFQNIISTGLTGKLIV